MNLEQQYDLQRKFILNSTAVDLQDIPGLSGREARKKLHILRLQMEGALLNALDLDYGKTKPLVDRDQTS